MRPIGLFLVVLLLAACAVEVRLDDKACDDVHACVDGWLCVEGRCVDVSDVPAGAEHGRCRSGGECDEGLVCLSAICVRPGDDGVDGGGQIVDDAGALDAGGGSVDGGAVDDDAGPPVDDAGPPVDDAGPFAADGGALDAGDGPADGGALDDDAGPFDVDSGASDAGPDPLERFGDGHDGPLVISGTRTMNTCVAITSTTSGGVVLAGITPAVSEGTALLLMQMQEEFATVADPSEVTSAGGAGMWELVRVVAIDGDEVLTRPAPAATFASDDGRRAQACTMPEHTDVTVTPTGRLVGQPWDGSVGGVVALFVDGALRVEAGGVIDVSGQGFRGGIGTSAGGGAGVTAEITSSAQGGGKGEGLDVRSYPLSGRGNFANGAGGGNAHNGGGGGGGGAGSGGYGGWEWDPGGDAGFSTETGGRPGSAIALPEGVFFGGGGGAGEQHHASAPLDGGSGGGAVLIAARVVVGGGAVRADGASPPGSTEAGGGGGGGGLVAILSDDASGFFGLISARGGDGADVTDDTAPLGPGGGGGGGAVSALENATVDVAGGVAGRSLDNERGATDGQPGSTF